VTDDVTTAEEQGLEPAATEPGPIVRRSLHDAVISRLRDMIIEGKLAPGTRIHEGQIGQLLGVSRTPLREALKALASEGLVELVPSRGAVVRRFTPKDVQDMLTVLGTLEALAGRLVCESATDAEIAEVRALHDEMLRLYAARDRLRYFKLNQSIHSSFLRLARNDTLVSIHEQLQSRLKRIRFIGHEGPEKWALAVSEHEEMIAALEVRDAERLAAALNRHMTEAWRRVKDMI
jgi:DNA-binding GntR family transcriptional regulator